MFLLRINVIIIKCMKQFLILLLILCYVGVGCDEYRAVWHYKNNSSQDIYIEEFPLLSQDSMLYIHRYATLVKSKQWYTTAVSQSFETYYKSMHRILDCDTLGYFIVSSDTLAKYGWERVYGEHHFLKRYYYSLQDVKRMGDKIIINYPPTPDMRDIKQYPPYGEDVE